jgi:hypothetical protein
MQAVPRGAELRNAFGQVAMKPPVGPGPRPISAHRLLLPNLCNVKSVCTKLQADQKTFAGPTVDDLDRA